VNRKSFKIFKQLERLKTGLVTDTDMDTDKFKILQISVCIHRKYPYTDTKIHSITKSVKKCKI